MYSLMTIILQNTEVKAIWHKSFLKMIKMDNQNWRSILDEYIYFIKVGMDNNHKTHTDNPIVAFLQSDITLHIAIVLAFIGMIAMSTFIFYLEGMARLHLSVVTFLFLGLFLSLLYFKSLKSNSEIKGSQSELQKEKKQQ